MKIPTAPEKMKIPIPAPHKTTSQRFGRFACGVIKDAPGNPAATTLRHRFSFPSGGPDCPDHRFDGAVHARALTIAGLSEFLTFSHSGPVGANRLKRRPR
jgi:hypothetical protein